MANHVPQLLTRSEVEASVRLTTSTIYRLMRSGKFPEPLRIGPRAVRWRASELDAWLEGRPYSHGEEPRARKAG